MKSIFIVAGLFVALMYSCGTSDKQGNTDKKTNKQDTVTDAKEHVIKEYFSNGKIKSETSAIGDHREGLTKNYNHEGILLSQVNYVNNTREGMATNFYAKTGKVNSTIVYKNGIKEGDEIWYYENGQPFRISPYVQAKIHGIQKFYYEDGKLMAEIPYKEGNPGIGLKEYKKDGSLITDYPTLKIKQKDYLSQANKVILLVELSSNTTDVKYFKGALTDGKYLNNKVLTLATQGGTAQIDFNIPPGSTINQKVVITASFKSPYGNPMIISKTYNLKASN